MWSPQNGWLNKSCQIVKFWIWQGICSSIGARKKEGTSVGGFYCFFFYSDMWLEWSSPMNKIVFSQAIEMPASTIRWAPPATCGPLEHGTQCGGLSIWVCAEMPFLFGGEDEIPQQNRSFLAPDLDRCPKFPLVGWLIERGLNKPL